MSGGGDDVTAEQDDGDENEYDVVLRTELCVVVVVCIGVCIDLRGIGLKKGDGEGSKRLGFREERLERREERLTASMAGGGN